MSAPRDDRVYIDHIRDAIARIESYVLAHTEDTFMASPLVQDAVMRQIQIIGEAANRLSPDFVAKAPRIPWADIVGMRNKLVHDYMGVDLEAVWDTAVRDMPALKSELGNLTLDLDTPAVPNTPADSPPVA